MKRYIWPVVWGFLVAFVLGYLLRQLELAAGEPLGFWGKWSPFVFGFLTFFLLANLAGNRKVKNASVSERAAVLNAPPPEGKILLVVFREGFIGMAAGLNVTVDGVVRAQLKSPRFTVLTLDPGRHEVNAGFGGLAGAQNNQGAYVFDAKPGEVVAVRATLSMGALKNTVKLEEAGDIDAVRAKLARMTMVKPEVGAT